MSNIYIVGTPIGNLEDLTFRAFQTLRKVDIVLAEDTRKTKVLLDRYKIDKKIISYYQHSKISKIEKIIELLKEGKDIALVTDAGTPGISDPGNELVKEIHKYIKVQHGSLPTGQAGIEPIINIIPIPGVSAVTTILSVSGFPTNDFLFLGFLPKKKGRETMFKKMKEERRTIVLFESPYRAVKTLGDIEKYLGDIDMVVGRELTKKFEEIKRGKASDLKKYFESKNIKGEFVLVLDNRE